MSRNRDPVESFIHNGLNVRIEIDEDPTSPRDDDNVGTMVCWHRRYTLGDVQPAGSPDDYLMTLLPDGGAAEERRREREGNATYKESKRLGYRYGSDVYLGLYDALHARQRDRLQAAVDKVAIILPLYLYDHSGITIRTSGFSCPWDSGQVGFIYATLADVRKEWSVKAVTSKIRAKAIACLEQEVKTYDDYLTGQVYGFIVERQGEDEDGEHVDSCWGFYGLDYCREEAKASAGYAAQEAREAATAES